MCTMRIKLACNVVMVGSLLVLVGCGPPTLDPSSFNKLESSVTKLREPMDPAYRARFDEALTYFVGEPALIDDADDETGPDHPELVLALYSPLKGMTADGIIADARLHVVVHDADDLGLDVRLMGFEPFDEKVAQRLCI